MLINTDGNGKQIFNSTTGFHTTLGLFPSSKSHLFDLVLALVSNSFWPSSFGGLFCFLCIQELSQLLGIPQTSYQYLFGLIFPFCPSTPIFHSSYTSSISSSTCPETTQRPMGMVHEIQIWLKDIVQILVLFWGWIVFKYIFILVHLMILKG